MLPFQIIGLCFQGVVQVGRVWETDVYPVLLTHTTQHQVAPAVPAQLPVKLQLEGLVQKSVVTKFESQTAQNRPAVLCLTFHFHFLGLSVFDISGCLAMKDKSWDSTFRSAIAIVSAQNIQAGQQWMHPKLVDLGQLLAYFKCGLCFQCVLLGMKEPGKLRLEPVSCVQLGLLREMLEMFLVLIVQLVKPLLPHSHHAQIAHLMSTTHHQVAPVHHVLLMQPQMVPLDSQLVVKFQVPHVVLP